MKDRAPGQRVWTLWQHWKRLPILARFGTIRQVVDIECKLADINFKLCGCVYFKEDLPHGAHLVTTGTTSYSILEQYWVGPSADMGYWRKAKATLQLSRGPCKYTWVG